MDLKTKEVGKILELQDDDCTIIIWTQDIVLNNMQDKDCEQIGSRTFKEGEKTLVKHLDSWEKGKVDMEFMDETFCVCVYKEWFEVPLSIIGNNKKDMIHNNVPEWANE